jgi:lipoate-protein ligase A
MNFLAFRSCSQDPYINLALEEALLEAEGAPPYMLLVYSNEPCVVIGRNQNPWAEVASDAGLPVLRRISGGGAVYQDLGNLDWALFVSRSRHDPDAEIGLIAHSLAALGIATRSGKRGGLFVDGGPLDGRKISGTARRMSADRVLHHGTLLVDADLARLARSLGGIEVAASRSLPSVPSVPANLSQLVPGLRMDEVATALAKEIARGGALEEIQTAIHALIAPGRIETIAMKLASWDWTYGQTLPFSVEASTPLGPLLIAVRGGIVVELGGPGLQSLAERARDGLLGSRFDPRSLWAAGAERQQNSR